MNLNDIIFIDNLAKLDLHGLDRESAKYYINVFIDDNIKMKNEIFGIIHGIGSGVLYSTTIETLKRNKNVIEYKTYYNNRGYTLVKIKI